MNPSELQAYVEELSLNYFNKPFTHRATFNRRLRTTGGRYHLETHDLDFNPKILEIFGKDIFEGIVKHELCHYHLHLENKGYKHGDWDFQNLLTQVGGLRYTPSMEAIQDSVTRWAYQCRKCETKIYRKRRFNKRKYVCANCNGFFKLLGKKELEVQELN